MKLSDLLSDIAVKRFVGDPHLNIKNITYDSRLVEPGSLFVCIRGLVTDGHAYINEALKRGASAIVVESWQAGLPVQQAGTSVSQILVADSRQALAQLSVNYFSHPSRELKLIGVTGTNGKTTTTHLIESILRKAGFRVGLLGTVEYRIGERIIPVSRTTPESHDLQRLLSQMVDEALDFAVLEVSSHAIDLKRIYGCQFQTGVLTNLSQDHLDFHGSLERYSEAKKGFFDYDMVDRIINTDDSLGKEIHQRYPEALSYGFNSPRDILGTEVELSINSTAFRVLTPKGDFYCSLKLPGLFNTYNALAAIGVATALDIDVAAIQQGLSEVNMIPGRFESIEAGQDFRIIVDYAHTPDSLKSILGTAREITQGRVITVFGCGGDRDRGKRPLMGEVAGSLSDRVIVTSDNPRSEDPVAIIGEIEAGLNKTGISFTRIIDRREAIHEALKMAKQGDLVLIAGKGHEKEQIFNDRTIPFDDRQVVIEILKEIAYCDSAKG